MRDSPTAGVLRNDFEEDCQAGEGVPEACGAPIGTIRETEVASRPGGLYSGAGHSQNGTGQRRASSVGIAQRPRGPGGTLTRQGYSREGRGEREDKDDCAGNTRVPTSVLLQPLVEPEVISSALGDYISVSACFVNICLR